MKENKSLLQKILNIFSKQETLDDSFKQETLDDLLVMSEHWDGYKRENSVRRLGMLGNSIAIPKLIVRVNDWVPQVRDAAKEALDKLLKPENAEAFVFYLPDLYRLQNRVRDNHSPLISNITHFLLEPNNSIYIKQAIKNDNPYIARIAVTLCIDHSLIDKHELVSECLSHSDIVIRNRVSNLLCDFSGEILESFLQIAIHDSFMPVRREAFQLYLRHIPEKGLNIANKFLFDKSFSIREIAIKQLLKQGTDVELLLINTIFLENQSVLKLRAAILGLAYLNSKQSIPIITKFVENYSPSIRKTSLQALAKLVGDEARSYLMTGLKDQSPSVAKESLVLINKLKINLSADDLLDMFEHSYYHHTFIACISMSKRINKWDRLIFLLHLFPLLSKKDSEKLKIVDNELYEWDAYFNLSDSQPSTIQMERIIIEYNQCKQLLREDRQKSLEFTMQAFRISR